jgi:hypothetical protein
MDDLPPSRSLRLLLVGMLALLLFAEASTLTAEVRSDSPNSDAVARAQGMRPATGRASPDAPDLAALLPPEPTAKDATAWPVAPLFVEIASELRSLPLPRSTLPRAPPLP